MPLFRKRKHIADQQRAVGLGRARRYLVRFLLAALVGLAFYQFYRWPSAGAQTSFMLLCESAYAEQLGNHDFSVKYAAATSGRFRQWQVSLIVQPRDGIPPPLKIYCIYDRSGLKHLQDVRNGIVYHRDPEQ